MTLFLKLRFLNLLLKPQFTNLCKSAVVRLAVLKITVKTAIYKPMQISRKVKKHLSAKNECQEVLPQWILS